MNPKYPVFIPSKGRWETRHTIRLFERLGIPFHAVVEPQEYDRYAAVMGREKLLVLPHQDKGLVVTRNWIWDFADKNGTPYFWTFDDNITNIYRLNKNLKVQATSGTPLRVIEDFSERYSNLIITGMAYEFFAPRRQKHPPLIINTRIYSNMLIRTDAQTRTGQPLRNEGFYNDDTDLCLRVLKDGACTVQFVAFTVKKIMTMAVKGGMTPHYQGDGRWKMAEELRRKHPDVVKVVRKWGRWQHQVDYRPFKRNRLIRKPGIVIHDGPNEYGMKLVQLAASQSKG